MMRTSRTHVGWLRVIAITIASLAATVAPLPEWLELLRPDFVALTVLWFSLLAPRLLGLSYAWCTGSRSTAFAACCSASTH